MFPAVTRAVPGPRRAPYRVAAGLLAGLYELQRAKLLIESLRRLDEATLRDIGVPKAGLYWWSEPVGWPRLPAPPAPPPPCRSEPGPDAGEAPADETVSGHAR